MGIMGFYDDQYKAIEAQDNATKDVIEVPKYNHELDIIKEIVAAILHAAKTKLPTKYEKLSKDGVEYVAWEVQHIYNYSDDIYLAPDNGQLYKGRDNGHIIETSHVQSLHVNKQGQRLSLWDITNLRVHMVKYAIENGIAIKASWGNEQAIQDSLQGVSPKAQPKGFFSKLFSAT